MAEIKKLQTRIALKHDTWANWHDETKDGQGANLVLLKGEIGFCEIPADNAAATTAPTVLFKVGDGTTPFKTLKWASALAADVYGWAKASDVVLEGKKIKFVGSNKELEIPYVTEAEVKELIKPVSDDVATLKSDVADLKSKFEGDGSVDAQLTALDGRLDAIEGEGDGSVKKALADAKAYTDLREVEINKYADQAEADAVATAKGYTDTEVKKASDAAAQVAADLADHKSAGNPHGITAATVGLDKVENKTVAEIKTEFTGAVEADNAGFVTGGAAHAAIEAAKSAAASDAEAKVKALAEGAVADNTTKIAENAAAIEALNKADGTIAAINTAIAKEAEDRAAADTLINEKFGAEYSKDNTVAAAIADAKKAGTDAQDQVTALTTGAVATNTAEISRVEGKFDDYVEAQTELGHEARIAAMEAFFDGAARDEGEGENLKNALDTLKEIQDFATGEGTAAAEMLDAIDANAKAIKAVEDIVKEGGTLEVRVDEAEAAITQVEADVDDIKTTLAGYDKDNTVSAAIAAAQSAAQTAAEATAAADATAKANAAQAAAEATAASALSSAVETLNAKDADLAAEIAKKLTATDFTGWKTTHETDHAKTATAITAEINAAVAAEAELRVAADNAINAKIGTIAEGTNVAGLISGVKTTAEDAQTRVAALEPKVEALETLTAGFDGTIKDAVDAAAAKGQTGIDNAASALAAAQGAQGAAEAAQADVDALEKVVGDSTSGLVKSVADNTSDISNIKDDYLKKADLFIIDCGTSTTVIHEEE